jgi:hypothetical protein
MSSPKAVPADAKVTFWAVVEDCLREFHGMRQDGIRRKAGKLRSGIDGMTTGEQEYFYHSEPFDVACEIADQPLDVQEYLDRYLHIRDEKHGNGVSKRNAQNQRGVEP